MKTILVDDEIWSMKDFERECRENSRFEVVGMFYDPNQALEYARNNQVDFALLDIEMPEIDGLTLAGKLRELHPDIILVFVTAYEKRLVESLKIHPDSVVLKPYTLKDVEVVLNCAYFLSARQKKAVFVRTFGRFEVFVNGKPVVFSSSRSKELLAILVNKRGGVLRSEEAVALMYEDRPYDNTTMTACRKAAQRLRATLKEYGIEGMLIENNKGRMINTAMFDCDYYMFLDGDKTARNSFSGEYMSQYSWAENTLASLERIVENLKRDFTVG